VETSTRSVQITKTARDKDDDILEDEICFLDFKETSDMNSFQTEPSIETKVDESARVLHTFKRLTPDQNFLESISVER
jgi:hypothetical protein